MDLTSEIFKKAKDLVFCASFSNVKVCWRQHTTVVLIFQIFMV